MPFLVGRLTLPGSAIVDDNFNLKQFATREGSASQITINSCSVEQKGPVPFTLQQMLDTEFNSTSVECGHYVIAAYMLPDEAFAKKNGEQSLTLAEGKQPLMFLHLEISEDSFTLHNYHLFDSPRLLSTNERIEIDAAKAYIFQEMHKQLAGRFQALMAQVEQDKPDELRARIAELERQLDESKTLNNLLQSEKDSEVTRADANAKALQEAFDAKKALEAQQASSNDAVIAAALAAPLNLAGAAALPDEDAALDAALAESLRESSAPPIATGAGAGRDEVGADQRELSRLQQENHRLREDIATLQAQLASLEELQRENTPPVDGNADADAPSLADDDSAALAQLTKERDQARAQAAKASREAKQLRAQMDALTQGQDATQTAASEASIPTPAPAPGSSSPASMAAPKHRPHFFRNKLSLTAFYMAAALSTALAASVIGLAVALIFTSVLLNPVAILVFAASAALAMGVTAVCNSKPVSKKIKDASDAFCFQEQIDKRAVKRQQKVDATPLAAPDRCDGATDGVHPKVDGSAPAPSAK